ncbi:MAG: tetratricopeptide repeat protein [Dongiaceae bacterium]
MAKDQAPGVASQHDRSRPSHGLAHGRHAVRRMIRLLVVLVVALTLVVVSGFGYTVWYFWPIPELAPAPLGRLILAIKGPIVAKPPSIAVLPFKGSGDDPARAEAYADALAEGISSALAKASEMFVIAQSSASIYKDRNEPVSQIARDLGVRYILDGSLQKWGDRVTIQVALIDTEKGEHRKIPESFEGTAEDFYSLQRSITLDVITSLQVELTEGEKERINLAHGTRNLDAWLIAAEAYKLLRHLTPDDNRRARALYVRAIALDPSYAGAQEGLAWTHFIDARFAWSSSAEQSIAEAVRLADVVLSLDATRPRVYSLLGSMQLINRNYDAAVELGEKAVNLEPNDADAAFLLGYTLTFTGKPQQAIGLIERAIERTPYPPGLYHLVLGRANRLAGFHEVAAAILEKIVAAESASYIPFVELAATYIELGATGKAKAAAERVMQLNPAFTISTWIQRPTFSDDATTAHEIEILRAAGLPE